MRIMIFNNGHLSVLKVQEIFTSGNHDLLIPCTPCGLSLLISNIHDTVKVLTRLSNCGWADLTMYPSEYINSVFQPDPFENGREREERDYSELER